MEALPAGAAVIRTFVPESQLRRGVARAWLLLGCVGLGLLALSVAVADQLARSLGRPLAAVAGVSDRLAAGDLSARATLAGPPEVRRVGAGLNHLAARIGELLPTSGRPSPTCRTACALRSPHCVSTLSHCTTPPDRPSCLMGVSVPERTVSKIIHDARRPAGAGDDAVCGAGMVVAQRAEFWRPLAEDTERSMTVDVAAGQIRVRVSHEDLATCADILLENVFAHTPDGAGCAVRLSHREPGGAWLVVADEGPGFPPSDPTERGRSSIGSTGLGLDIARRIAESFGGTLMIGRSAWGGDWSPLGSARRTGSGGTNGRHSYLPAVCRGMLERPVA